MKEKKGTYRILLNPDFEYLRDFITSLPDDFNTTGEVMHAGRNTIKIYTVSEVRLVVKSFKVPIWINKIAYGFFRESKSYRSYIHAEELLKRGVSTPIPVASLEEFKMGMLFRSYYISLLDTASLSIVPYVYGQEKNDSLLVEMARFISFLHKQGVYHLDLSPGNILAEQDGESYRFSLVDINRMRFHPVTEEEAYKNFDRLCRSVEVSTFLACEYAKDNDYDQEKAIDMVNGYSDDFFSRKCMSYIFKDMKHKKGAFYAIFGPLCYYKTVRRLRILLGANSRQHILFRKEESLYKKYLSYLDIRQSIARLNGYELYL